MSPGHIKTSPVDLHRPNVSPCSTPKLRQCRHDFLMKTMIHTQSMQQSFKMQESQQIHMILLGFCQKIHVKITKI